MDEKDRACLIQKRLLGNAPTEANEENAGCAPEAATAHGCHDDRQCVICSCRELRAGSHVATDQRIMTSHKLLQTRH